MGKVRTRFAPSPTGFLHVGGAYSAFLDFAWAKKNKGKFIIRIEDTDLKRSVPGAEEAIFQGLSWLGIEADESPLIGGSSGPYRQSERLPIYQKYAQDLVGKGDAYYCFCSEERLEKAKEERQKSGLPPMYDKKCRKLKKQEAKEKAKKEKYVIRLKVPENERFVISEPIRGEIVFDSNIIDDQVLLKSDGFPTYHLAVVVDDYLMKITHVVRGEEWLSSAPKHYLLYRYFGWEPPLYFHTPTIRNPDRSKLSKRKGHASLDWYREKGYLPEALINFLCLLGWSHPEEREVFDINEFIQLFDLEDLSPVGPIFDLRKLDWLNGVYIRKKTDRELGQLLENFAPQGAKTTLINQSVPLVKERLTRLSDYSALAGFFFEEPEVDSQLFEKNVKEQLSCALEVLEKVKTWNKKNLEQSLKGLVKEKGWQTGDFFMNFRIAITGSKITPPITESVVILGQETTTKRLRKAIEILE